jgi:Glycosyltransferase like family 2
LIEKAAASYRGPHRLRLNRNPRNLHPGHFREIWPLVETDYCVLGHGDDVSLPDRVEKQIAYLLKKNLSAVTCNLELIDREGRSRGYRIPRKGPVDLSLERFFKTGGTPAVIGAGMAWHREVLDLFGEPKPPTRNTDQIMCFRAVLLRGHEMMRAPLVRWRQTGVNRTPQLAHRRAADDGARMKVRERWLCARVANAHAMLYDLDAHFRRHPEDPRRETFTKGRRQIQRRLMKDSREWTALRFQMTKLKLTLE